MEPNMKLDTMRHGRIARSDFLQELFFTADHIVNRLVASAPLQYMYKRTDIPELNEEQDDAPDPYDPRTDRDVNVPCYSVYKDSQPRRLPVTLGLNRFNVTADCVQMLREAIIAADMDPELPLHKFALAPFGEACSMTVLREVLREEYVKKGCWMPLEVRWDTPESEGHTILWTCITKVAVLEYLALMYDKPQVAYCAHACLQMHCPLACYIQENPHSDDQLRGNARMYNLIYPNPNQVCWAPRGWDLSPLMDECGFFTKQPIKATGSRRKKQTKKPELSEVNSILEQLRAGYTVLQDIFRKSLPFKCAIRGLVFRIREECKTDRSVGDILIELFHCSMLGGYPDAKFRPSFVTLMHLYNAFFIKPQNMDDMLSWFHKDRGEKRNDFLFDDSGPFRKVWDGHPFTPQISAAWEANCNKMWSVMAMDREAAEEKRRNTPATAFVAGKGPIVRKSKRVKESRNYQRLLMLSFQEMMVFMLPFDPALYQAIRGPCKWEHIAANATTQMDLVRRCIDSGMRLKQLNAMRMWDAVLKKDNPFPVLFAKAWPGDVFLATYGIVHSREFNVIQLQNSPLTFEAQVMTETSKIDTERRTMIETFNAMAHTRITKEMEAFIKVWGIRNPHNLSQFVYMVDFLETMFPPFVEKLKRCKDVIDYLQVPIEAPLWELIFALMDFHTLIIDKLFQLHRDSTPESGSHELETLLRSLGPNEYTLVKFCYTYAQKRRSLQVYRLPQDVLNKQKVAVARKFKLKSTNELLPTMTTAYICPCCNKIKPYLANADPRDVTAFGNAMSAIDPLTMKVYCANKIKKPSKSRRTKDQSEINTDLQRAEIETGTQELDAETRKKHKRMFTCHSKAMQKNMMQLECNATELVAVNLLGTIAVFNDYSYTVCPSCGSAIQLTSNSFRGDSFSCGNCTMTNDTVCYAACAYCKAMYLPEKDADPILTIDEKRTKLQAVLDRRDPTLTTMPRYDRTWVTLMIHDDTETEKDRGLPPPFIYGTNENTRTTSKRIYLCAQHDKAWILYEQGILKWSLLHKRLKEECFSFYMAAQRKFMPYDLSKGKQRAIRLNRVESNAGVSNGASF